MIFLVPLSVFQKKSHECVNNYYFLMGGVSVCICVLTQEMLVKKKNIFLDT